MVTWLTQISYAVNLNHFRLLRVVGKGAFGKVRIVERKDTGLTFALKYIRKDEGWWIDCKFGHTQEAYTGHSGAIGKRAEHYQRAEDAGAPESSLSLQFAVQLSRYRISVRSLRRLVLNVTWLTTGRYIVVDLMNGGDLRFHISRKTFTEDAVRFWMAELGCALRYCHSQGIVHRDLKPDNVLLDSDGHVHLADFVSFGLKRGRPRRALTVYRMLPPNTSQKNNYTASLAHLRISLRKSMPGRGT